MLEAHMSKTMFHFRMVANNASFNFIDDAKSETIIFAHWWFVLFAKKWKLSCKNSKSYFQFRKLY